MRNIISCFLGIMILLSMGCQNNPNIKSGNTPKTTAERRLEGTGKLLGEDIVIFGGDPDPASRGGAGGIGVNGFLWRAALDTLSFMPLQSADPFGGVIITDWYSPSETPDKRYKMTVYILDTQLRANGIKVSMFKQTLDKKGHWREAPLSQSAIRDVEDTILSRARELRIASK